MYNSVNYITVDVSGITDEMMDNAVEDSRDTLRLSADGNKAILKWEGTTPSCFDGMTTYSHSEILEILKGSDWSGGE